MIRKFVFQHDQTSGKIILALLPCLIAAFLALAGGIKTFPFLDCNQYLQLSSDLWRDFSFGVNSRTPGYPFLLMLFSWLGIYKYLAVNLLFLFGITWFTMGIAKKWKLANVWIIPFIITLSPGLLTLGSAPLTEIPFIFFLVAAVYCVLRDKIMVAAICLSCATICRPIGLFLFVIFSLWLLWRKKKAIVLVAFVLIANIFPALWVVRNYVFYDHAVFCPIRGQNLLQFKAAPYLSWRDNIPVAIVRRDLKARFEAIPNLFDKSEEQGKLARKILLENFFGFCFWMPRNIKYFFMPDITPAMERLNIMSGGRGTYDVLQRAGPFAALKYYFNGNYFAMALFFSYMGVFVLFGLIGILGTIYLYKNKNYEALALTGALMLYFAVMSVGNTDWRFRMSVAPFIFVIYLAGCAFCLQYYKKLRQRHSSGDVE